VGHEIHCWKQQAVRGIVKIMLAAGAASALPAWAQDSGAASSGAAPVELSPVSVNANKVESAPYQAPSKAPLEAAQPTSVISQQYIQNNIAPGSNYDDIIRISPSVSSIAPNGPGLQENSFLSIRGFQDGQYNLTLDGIPWGDSNDFTHHTTSYFMNHDLGDVVVDRGPGSAETVGNATFGGTIALNTKLPAARSEINPYLSGGSFNTLQGGLEYDTGELKQHGGATAFIDGERLTSDGYLTHEGQTRDNVMFKVVRPLGEQSAVTVVAMYNDIHQNIGLGATQAEIDAHGPDYQLSADPTQQNYYDYNSDDIHTDFEYIDFKTRFDGGWSLDSKVYTYAYYHTGKNGEDPNGFTPNGTVLPGGDCSIPVNSSGTPTEPNNFCNNDVPGERLTNNYRSFGTIDRLTRNFGPVETKAGLWVDNQTNLRELTEVDYTQGGLIENLSPYESPSGPIDRLQHNELVTIQPYVEFDWKVTPDLLITPGVKYAFFRRRTDAPVNQGTQTPLDYSKNYQSPLPSIAAHYTIQPNWTAYAQVAEGFLAPNLNLLYVANPAGNTLQPQKTWNYQIGTAWQSERLSADADLYFINFSNYITSNGKPEPFKAFINAGDADYAGAEIEATYYLGQGLNLFGNASYNSAKYKPSGQFIAEVPDATWAGGVIYNRHDIYASFVDKWIGRRLDSSAGNYGPTQGNNQLDQEFSPYSDLMLAAGYTMHNVLSASSVSLRVTLDNLLNVTKLSALSGTTVTGDPAAGAPASANDLYWTVAGRSVIATLSAKF
jgi:iron complex outermembrane recepter protein